jgi:MFS family permease
MKNKNRIAVMISIVLGMLVVSMDTTIINTTMPIIADSLGDIRLYAWTFASYMIFSTVLAPIAGRLSDLFGRKRVFAVGIVLFMIGSILCGSAETMLQLVLFRAVQGIGAGVMLPFPLIIAGDLFSVEKRGQIQAAFTAMWGLSAVIAPLLGSLFVEYVTWRWIFYVNVPICLLTLLLLLPYKEEYEPKRSAVDYWGALIFSAGISLLLAVTVVGSYHVLYALGGALLLVFFYGYEKRHRAPIVPLTLLRNKPIAWMNTTLLFAYMAMFGTTSYLPRFLQEQGYSVFMSGLALIGMSVGWMSVSVPAGRWILRYGYRPLIITANAMVFGSGVWLLFISESSGFWFIFMSTVTIGLAFGLLSTVSVIGSQQLVDKHEKGVSTSLSMFSRNIGTAVGVTVMGAILDRSFGSIEGYQSMFYYGTSLSLLGLLTSFMIRDRKREVRKAASVEV